MILSDEVHWLWLAAIVGLSEIGWLLLWPLSVALSHSPAFTAAMLDLVGSAPRQLLPGVSDASMTQPLGDPAYIAPTVALCGVFLFLAAIYLVGLFVVGRGGAAPVLIVAAALLFQLTLLFLPGLFSQDVFSYVAYGRLAVVYGLNPYIWPPSAIAKDAVVGWVADVWRTYPAPYGPLWLDVQWLMARVFGGLSIPDQALAYRAFASFLLLANLAVAWPLLGRLTQLDRPRRSVALAALAWNPLVLFEFAGNAHNDVLMITFSLLAILLLVRSRNELSIAAFTLGALVKYLSGLGVAWLALAELVRPREPRAASNLSAIGHGYSSAPSVSEALRVLALVIVAAAVTLLVAWPWLELPDSLEPLISETANVGYVNALPDNLTIALSRLVGAPVDVARGVERLIIIASFVAYVLWEARRVVRSPNPEAITRATARSILIYIVVVSTSVQPWYFGLPVALAILRSWDSRLARVTIAYSLLALPALYSHYYLRDASPIWLDLVYGFAPLCWLVLDRRLPAGARTHEPATLGVGDDHDRADGHGLPGTVVEQASR